MSDTNIVQQLRRIISELNQRNKLLQEKLLERENAMKSGKTQCRATGSRLNQP